MRYSPGAAISRLFQTRDELSFRNIRGSLLPVLLVFPLAVIMGNLRYYDHGFAFTGFGSSQLMFFSWGLVSSHWPLHRNGL
jgi:hypothetical protein